MACFYDFFDEEDGYATQQQNFLLHYAQRHAPALDVGAGTGSAALFLAARGTAVTCVEPASAMRNTLLMHVGAQPALHSRVSVLPNWRHVPKQHFGLTYASNVLLHVVDDEERRELLHNMRSALVDDGLCILDFRLGRMALRVGALSAERTTVGRVTYRRYTTVHQHTEGLEDGLFDYRWEFESVINGDVFDEVVEDYVLRFDDVSSIALLLQQCGFTPVSHYANFQFAALAPNSTECVVVAKRD